MVADKMSKMAHQKKGRGGKAAVGPVGEVAVGSGMTPFDFQPRTRLVFGLDSVERVGELARELGIKKILLVTDPGIVAAGHADRVQHLLIEEGVAVTVFGNAHENPTTRDVDDCLKVAKAAG